MKHVIHIPQPPAPVFYPSVDLDVRYIVVRADGQAKIFQSLAGNISTLWDFMANHAINPEIQRCVLIPLDVMTAHRLGLVTFEELGLPEGARAFLQIINPPR